MAATLVAKKELSKISRSIIQTFSKFVLVFLNLFVPERSLKCVLQKNFVSTFIYNIGLYLNETQLKGKLKSSRSNRSFLNLNTDYTVYHFKSIC